MITKTDAVVLKSMKFRDTSKIVTFYTRRYGKLKAIAKGARETKSKFGASLEPMTLVGLVLYRKEQRELQLLSQCDIIAAHKRLHSEIASMSAALTAVELVDKLTHDEEENPQLFSLLVGALDCFESTAGSERSILRAFKMRLASVFGFTPSMDRCSSCGKASNGFEAGERVSFRVSNGSVLCPSCTKSLAGPGRKVRSYSVDAESLVILRKLLSEPLESVGSLNYSAGAGNEIDETLRLYFQYHFEGLKSLKSEAVFQKLLA